MKDVYDVVISIGEMCYVSMAFRKMGLQVRSFPFDWVAQNFHDGGKFYLEHNGFMQKVDLICNGFKDAFELEDFELLKRETCGLSVINKKTKFEYIHDFPADKTIQEYFPKFKEKSLRRISRMYEMIDKADRVLFVGMNKVIIEDNILMECGEKLKNRFPNKKVDVLFAIQDDVRRDSVRLSDNLVKTFFKPLDISNDISGVNTGFNPEVRRVLSNVRLKVDNFETLADIDMQGMINELSERNTRLALEIQKLKENEFFFFKIIKKLLLRLVCCFIPSKELRRKIRVMT